MPAKYGFGRKYMVESIKNWYQESRTKYQEGAGLTVK